MKGLLDISFLKCFVVAVATMIATTGHVRAQACSCPIGCLPCVDGISQFSLQYNGDYRALITAKDDFFTLYSATLKPGDIFVVTGKLTDNRFSGSSVFLFIDGQQSISLDVTCNGMVAANFSYGDFVIVEARTLFGTPVCCMPYGSDRIAPVFKSGPADITTTIDKTTCIATATWTDPVISDCNFDKLTQNLFSGSSFPVGSTLVKYTAKDKAGNVTVYTFTVTVNDTHSPIINNVPASVTTTLDAGKCTAKVTWNEPAVDDCNPDKMTVNYPSGYDFPVGKTTVTYSATDKTGNVTEKSFDVTVIDNQKPVFTGGPANLSFYTDIGKCTAAVTWTEPAVSDCSLDKVTKSHQPGKNFPIGTTEVKYTAVDKAGNTSVYTFNVQVIDKQSPEFADIPPDIVAVLPENGCTVKVKWREPTVKDCNLNKVTKNYAPNASFPPGITEVVYKATDKAGNVSSIAFKIIVTDTKKPVFETTPINIVLRPAEGKCVAVATWDEPVVKDCSLKSVTSDYASGSEFPSGITTVTYTAVDDHQNVAEATFTVTVEETIAPEFLNCPTNIEITTNKEEGDTVSWTEPKASDNCSTPAVQNSHAPGIVFPPGVTTVTYTAIDANNNSTTCSFTVTVIYESLPEEPTVGEPVVPIAISINPIITPDGDGKNDTWIIDKIAGLENRVMVFDRWGSVIYTASDYDNERVVWDGTSGGSKVVPTGTYFYVVSYISEGRTFETKGFLELVQ
jgi:large repetitive protein